MSGVQFDRQSAQRISDAVRKVEKMPARVIEPRQRTMILTPEPAWMLKAQEAMGANDTGYSAKYLEADGTEGTAITVRRPNGIYISSGDVGFLGKDSSGQWIFIPANMREEANMPLVIEVRTSDPGAPVTGQEWLRSDL